MNILLLKNEKINKHSRWVRLANPGPPDGYLQD